MLDYKIAPCFCPSLMNMRRKLVCGLLVNSQIFYFWSIVFIRILALVVLPFALAFGGSLTLALPAPLMQLTEQVTEKSMALDYDGAMALAKKVRGSDDGVGCVLEDIVRVSRYDDALCGKAVRGVSGTGVARLLRDIRILHRQEFQLGPVQVRSPQRIPCGARFRCYGLQAVLAAVPHFASLDALRQGRL